MRLTKAWSAVPEGEIYPVHFAEGDTLTGDLLARAQALGIVAAPEVCAAVDLPEPAPVARRGKRNG